MTPAMVAMVRAENAAGSALMRVVRASTTRLKLRLTEGERAAMAVLQEAERLENEAASAIVDVQRVELQKADGHAREEIAAAILLALLARGSSRKAANDKVTAFTSQPAAAVVTPNVAMAKLAGKALANNWAGGNVATLSRAEAIAKAGREAAAQIARLQEAMGPYRAAGGLAKSVPPPETFRPKALQLATDTTTRATNEARANAAQRMMVEIPEAAGLLVYRWDASLDLRTCPRCSALNGQEWERASDVPECPVHSRCRCQVRVVAKSAATAQRPTVVDRALSAVSSVGVANANFMREGMRDMTQHLGAYAGADAAEANLIATGQMAAKNSGKILPPVTVVVDDGEVILRDGRHRLMAAQQAGAKEIRANLISYKNGQKVEREVVLPIHAAK